MLLSIIVTTKNEEKHIRNCIESIFNQTHSDYEIILVDNYSTDRTIEIAKNYVQQIYLKGPERSTQRNYAGLKIAKGDWLLIIDADMILSPYIVELIQDNIANYPLTDAFYTTEVIIGKTNFQKFRRFEQSFYNGTAIEAVRVIKKSTFIAVNGYDENLYAGEDWDIDERIRSIGKTRRLDSPINDGNLRNYPLSFTNFLPTESWNPKDLSTVILHNESDLNLCKYLEKKKYYSKNLGKYINKWGKNHIRIRKQFGIPYRFFFVFIENEKFKWIIRYPFYYLAIIIIKACVGFNLLTILWSQKIHRIITRNTKFI